MNKARSFTILSLIALLFVSVCVHFYNTESYLNNENLAKKSRDYDRDGEKERDQSQAPEALKVAQLNILPTAAHIVPVTFVVSEKYRIPVKADSNFYSLFVLSIFKPPIFA